MVKLRKVTQGKLSILNSSSSDHHGADSEVNSDSGHKVLAVAVIRKTKEQTGLAHTWTIDFPNPVGPFARPCLLKFSFGIVG